MNNNDNYVNEKNKIILKFTIYMTFLIIVIALVLIVGIKNNNNFSDNSEIQSNSTVDTKSYIDMQRDLLNRKNYVLNISGTDNYIFNVIDNDDELNFIDKDGNQVDIELYTDIDKKIFDFEDLFDKLNKASTIIDKASSGKIYNYLDIDGYRAKVYVNDKYIYRMIIENDINTYLFTFDY